MIFDNGGLVMEERITPYLQILIRSGKTAIEIQFREVRQEGEERFGELDPLSEESHYTPVKGLVHKYSNFGTYHSRINARIMRETR